MKSIAQIVLRVGSAFAFLYPPLAALSDPTGWFSYFPSFIRALPVPSLVLLHGFGLIEVVLAVWVLSGWRIRIPAAIMTVMLLAIVVSNLSDFTLLFRDVAIAAMTLALALSPANERTLR
jgi:uncharacterized membrane protein YphA (DoxX/SURF4 family)